VALKLVNTRGLVSNPRPTQTYDQALERLAALQAKDGPQVNPICATTLLTHGHATERVIIFLHGFTNCPKQFLTLGQQFFERGYNVLLPRFPYHGYKDRMSAEFSQLTAEDLATFTDEVVDIGRGLGQHLTMGGLSAGSVASAWAYQFRSDVNQALVIAPSFGLALIPKPLNSSFTNVARSLPNAFIWWDDKVKMGSKPDYAYPRFSSRALAEIVRLGYATRYAATEQKPAGGRAVLVLVGGDPGVNNGAARQVADAWEKQGARVIRYEFPAEMKLIHDLIDPQQPWQQVAVVYPKLIALAETD